MPLLQCTFCGHSWKQSPISFWNCPSCEMGVAREIVIGLEEEEIDQLWSIIKNIEIDNNIKLLVSDGHNSYFDSDKLEDLKSYLDLLVLLYDNVILPELWKGLEDTGNFTKKLLYYYDSGAIIPLDQGGMPNILQIPDFKINKHIIKKGRYINIYEHFILKDDPESINFFWLRENLMKMLTFLDFNRKYFTVDDLYEFMLEKRYIEPGNLDYAYYCIFRPHPDTDFGNIRTV